MKKHLDIYTYSNPELILWYKQNRILDLRVIKPKQTKDHTTLNQFSHENKSKPRWWLTYLLVSLSVAISGITEGRPWAHWKGRSHRERDWRRSPHSSWVRASPNLMAPVVRSEIQQLKTNHRVDMYTYT